MKSVVVLMSTYNGQKYVVDQLESLIKQQGVELSILIRDDGSNDNTIDILKKYANNYHFFKIFEGVNKGVLYSFTALCRYALDNLCADYYAFCDQDDVWDSNKLMIAVEKLNDFPSEKANLYFSNARLVDENLSYIRDLYSPGEIKIGKKMALVQIPTFGCCCVFNRKALEYFLEIPNQKQGHDHWIYLICSFFGNVYYDEGTHIDYRQHKNNVSGKKEKGWKLILVRLHTLFVYGLDHNFDEKAKQLLQFKDRLNREDYDYIYKVANYRNRLKYKLELLFSKNYRTGNFMKDLTIIIRILVNKL